MITGYHRPENKDEALKLLSRSNVHTIGICGSTRFGVETDRIEVVDLQALDLTHVDSNKDLISCDGLITLDDLLKSEKIPHVIKKSLIEEYTVNQRNSTTLAGAVFTSEGNSLLTGVLMAFDARIKSFSEDAKMPISDLLTHQKRKDKTAIVETVEFSSSLRVSYEVVRKSPLAPVMIGVIVAIWGNGRQRIVITGETLNSPVVIFDENDHKQRLDIIKNACSQYIKTNKLTKYYSEIILTLLTRLDSHAEEGV
jgi:CO/xanthine dehydrogenase FAD-binding subunit